MSGDVAAAAEYASWFGDKPINDAVLEVVCRAARLPGSLCGDISGAGTGYTDEMSASIGQEAYELVTQYVRVLFGESNTPKMHALAYHLVDEFLRRGNLIEADTRVKEMLHEVLKAFFVTTNRHPASFHMPVMCCEMTLFQIVAEDLKDSAALEALSDDELDDEAVAGIDDEDRESGDETSHAESDPWSAGRSWRDGYSSSGADGDVDSDGGTISSDPPTRGTPAEDGAKGLPCSTERGRRLRGRHTTLARVMAAENGSLVGLPGLMGKPGTTRLVVANTVSIDAKLLWQTAAVRQRVRAAHEFYNRPWFNDVYLPHAASTGGPLLGQARLVLRSVDGDPQDAVVVQLLEASPDREGCVLTAFGCRRMRWRIDEATGHPALSVVPVEDIIRLEHVVPNFEDLTERKGLFGTRLSTGDSSSERVPQRFSTNVYFPWTSVSITGTTRRPPNVAE